MFCVQCHWGRGGGGRGVEGVWGKGEEGRGRLEIRKKMKSNSLFSRAVDKQ